MKSLGTFLLYIVLPVAFLVFLFWIGWGGGLGQNHNLAMKDFFGDDIGLVSIKSPPIQKGLTIINKGKESVTIGRIYTDCKCLSAIIPEGKDFWGPFGLPTGENLEPLGINVDTGGEIPIKITFSPSIVGAKNFSGTVFIETLKAEEILRIPVTANVINQ